VSPDQEQQLAQFRAPSQAIGGPAAAAAPAQGQGAPAQANPLSKLNSALGLNIGAPFQGAALRQSTDAMPAATQMAGAFGQLDETRKAALIAQRIQDAGINLDPTQPGFEAQKRAAEGIYNSMNGGQPGGSFMPQPITAYAPTGLRDRAIGANGGEVAGAGGVMVSTRGTNAEGGNRFMLRSGPKPPEGLTSRPAPVQQPVQAQQGPTPLQQQQEAYRAALAPKDNAPSGYRSNADGTLSFIPGGPADPSLKDKPKENLPTGYERDPQNPSAIRPMAGSDDYVKRQAMDEKKTQRMKNAVFSARSTVGYIDDAINSVDGITTGLGGVISKRIPGRKAYNLKETLETIAADVSFSRLQQMREESPTGGALGNVANYELEALKRSKGSLDQGQSPKRLKENLSTIRKHYERFMMANSGFDPDTAEGRAAWAAENESNAQSPVNGQSSGGSIDDLVAKYAQ
jgi:hypothetical protein